MKSFDFGGGTLTQVFLVVAAFLSILGIPATGEPALQLRPAGITAFIHVSVVPMDREGVLHDQTVVVRGNRITDIGPAASVKIPDEASRIDGRGKYLMPGLADMHAHILNEDQLTLFVANGVTTVCNMVGTRYHLIWREQINNDDLLGPTIYTAGPIIDGNPPEWPFFSAVVETPEQAELVVAEQREADYDFLKILEGLPRTAYDALMEAAKAGDMRVLGHVPGAVGIEHALAAGQVRLEHLSGYAARLQREDAPTAGKTQCELCEQAWKYLDEGKIAGIVRKTREAGAWNCPTLTIHHRRMTPAEARKELAAPRMKYVDPGLRTGWLLVSRGDSEVLPDDIRQGRRARGRLVKALHDAGAGILLGTDSATLFVVHGFSIHDELRNFVDTGLTPYEAIKAGTRDAAEFFDALDEWGTVAVGRRADLILVEDNPLNDVRAIAKRVGVMVRGKWYPQAELQAKLDALAEKYSKMKAEAGAEPPDPKGE